MAKYSSKGGKKCANLSMSRKSALKSNKKMPKGQDLDKVHYDRQSVSGVEKAPKKIW